MDNACDYVPDHAILVNHLLVGGMRKVVCNIYQFAWQYLSYQDLEQSSLLNQYKPSPASHWMRAYQLIFSKPLSPPSTMTSQYHIISAIAPNPCILQEKQSGFWRLLARINWELEKEFQMWLSLQKTALPSFICFMSNLAGLQWIHSLLKGFFSPLHCLHCWVPH